MMAPGTREDGVLIRKPEPGTDLWHRALDLQTQPSVGSRGLCCSPTHSIHSAQAFVSRTPPCSPAASQPGVHTHILTSGKSGLMAAEAQWLSFFRSCQRSEHKEGGGGRGSGKGRREKRGRREEGRERRERVKGENKKGVGGRRREESEEGGEGRRGSKKGDKGEQREGGEREIERYSEGEEHGQMSS